MPKRDTRICFWSLLVFYTYFIIINEPAFTFIIVTATWHWLVLSGFALFTFKDSMNKETPPPIWQEVIGATLVIIVMIFSWIVVDFYFR